MTYMRRTAGEQTKQRKGLQRTCVFTMEDQPGGQWWMGLCFRIRESFLSFVCGLNLGDGWDTGLIFPVAMYRKVSVSTKDRSTKKPLKS